MDIQERLIEVPLDSSEVVLVRPLSPFALQALQEAARQAFPPPDKKAFEKPLSDIAPNAMPGVMMPAEENPEYQVALKNNRADYNGKMIELTLLAGVIVDTPEGREATIERYAGRMERLRKLVPLPEDDWLATTMYGMLSSFADRGRVASAAINPLTEKEVRFALRSFRCEVQRDRSAHGAGSEIASVYAPTAREAQAAAD